MSRSDRIQKDLLRAARRAQRLAERARRRTDRQAERARRAASRAEALAKRAAGREDDDLYIDDPGQFENWVNEALDRVEASLSSGSRRRSRSRRRPSSGSRSSARRKSRVRRAQNRSRRGLYRDPDQAKVCGVCAGFAEYLGVEVWKVRLGAILGLMFLPQVTFIGYFVAYFVMDKKPYYRRMTDRYDRAMDLADDIDDLEDAEEIEVEEQEEMEPRAATYSNTNSNAPRRRSPAPHMTNATALRTARSKFVDLEERLRAMESHVTSSQFELQREFNKISGENRA